MQPISQKLSILESLDNKSIAPDEAFFHKFFQIKDDRKQVSKRKAKSQDADDSDEDSSLAEDDFLAGEEGDDGAFGDMDHGYDYDQLAEAMQDPGDASSDYTSMSSLEGEEFPSLSGEQESGEDYSSVEDIVESDMDEEDAKDKEEVFASLDDYSEMIAKDF